MRDIKMYAIQVIIGIIGNVTMIAFPLYYAAIGMSAVQVGILTSAGFIGVIFLPFIGSITDKIKRPKLVLQVNLILLGIFTLIMMHLVSFQAILVVAVLISICKMAMFNLGDIMLLDYAQNNNLNYGKYRSGLSLGFGIGLFIIAPFIFLKGVETFLFVITFISILVAFLFIFIPEKTYEEEEKHYIEDIKILSKNRKYILMVIINSFFKTATGIKLSYQALLYDYIGLGAFFIALANLAQILPELVLLPMYEKKFEKFGYNKLMVISIFIIVFQLLALVLVTHPFVLLFVSTLHGASMGFFLPTYAKGMKNSVGESVVATGFMVNSTIVSLATFAISLLIITPIFGLGNIYLVFITLMIIALIALIPLMLLSRGDDISVK